MAEVRLQEASKSILEASNKIVETTQGLPSEELRWKPSEEAWSISEILSHLEECLAYWPVELESVVSTPGIEWGRGLQDPVRLAAVGRQLELSHVLDGIRRNTQRAIEMLGKLHDKDLEIESPSRNPRFGVKPMAFIVDHMMVEHLEKHLRQIQRNIAQYSVSQSAG